jgi:hypothetical protein
MSQPPASVSINDGALTTSCLKPLTTAGTISAASSTIARSRITKIRPVAIPRFHPRFANQSTAGSSAKDRNNAIPIVVRKLVSCPSNQSTATTVSAAPTKTK